VAIEAAQLHDFAVERESVIGKRRLTEADAPRLLIYQLMLAHQSHTHLIEPRMIQIP
jgi:hypothetical protein